MSVHLLINRLGGQWWSTFQYKIAWHALAHILAVFQRISHGKTKSLTLICWGKLAALKHPVTSPPLSLARSCALNEGLLYTKGCKQDLKLTGIDLDSCKLLADDRISWHLVIQEGDKRGKEMHYQQLEGRRQHTKQTQQTQVLEPHSNFTCNASGRDCHERIGLLSHSRRCPQKDWS